MPRGQALGMVSLGVGGGAVGRSLVMEGIEVGGEEDHRVEGEGRRGWREKKEEGIGDRSWELATN